MTQHVALQARTLVERFLKQKAIAFGDDPGDAYILELLSCGEYSEAMDLACVSYVENRRSLDQDSLSIIAVLGKLWHLPKRNHLHFLTELYQRGW